MTDLSRDALELLAAAADVNAAPPAIRKRGRARLVGALAAGTVTTSTLVAKGAWLAAKSASLSAAPATASTSLTATMVSAVVIGLSTGLVAVTPTSKAPEARPAVTVQAPVVNKAPVTRTVNRVPPRAVLSVEAAAPVAEESTAIRVEPPHSAPAGATPQPETRNAVVPTSETHRDVTAPSSPTKASIARETELLAEAQRALKSGQALKALYTLDRHAEEFPTGQLYEEATAARVVALCAVGRTQDGQRWTNEFLRRYPNSPLSARVRGACDKSGTSE